MKGKGIAYSGAEMAWLEANRTMVITDYHRAFLAAFPREDVKAVHLHALRKRKGWKVGRAKGRLAGRRRIYSPAEIAWLRSNSTLPNEDYFSAFCATFKRADISLEQITALRHREGWLTGRTGRFEKGIVPQNKGKRCAPGTGGHHPNAQQTQFKKGLQPHNYRAPGYETIDPEGYVRLIVAETNPYTGAPTRRVFKHRWLWEKANGPLPKGHVLKCLDSDRANTDPSNWAAIHRGVLWRLNGGPRKKMMAYDEAPTELKPAVLAVAKLKHRIGQSRKREDAA